MTSYFALCAPRIRVLLQHHGLESVLTRFDGWEITAGGRSRLIRQTDVDRMALEGDYAAIDGLIRGISLDLTYSRRVAQKRRVFRTRQRSIKVRVS